MCGIAGIINYKKPVLEQEIQEIEHLLAAQRHRGPDNKDFRQVSNMALLGSLRLRITDAYNPDADMPMVSVCNRYTLVYNGEIYNHRNLRHELSDYNFRTESDTETLLAAYMKWGSDCLNKLEGMFAFCIFDNVTQETFFTVDPSGQKFLYYLQDKNSFVFTSEITALITDPYREKNWDINALKEYLAQRMILGADTHIKEIKKMEPGTCGLLKADGIFTIRRYHAIPMGNQNNTNLETIKNEIGQAVADACQETFDLEVPYGHLLSGGIDSSIVTHYAKQHNLDLSTYSIGFEEFEGEAFGIPSTFNEFEYSRFISKHLGTNHQEIRISPEEYCELIDKWIAMMGEPLEADEAPMLVKLFETASEQHRVIFCGSGPDEAFDGYGLGQALGDIEAEKISNAYYDKFNWSFKTDLDQLIPGHQDIRQNVIEKINGFLKPYREHTQNPLQLAQLINLHGRMSAYEFRQMDVISMHYSVETRSPLADKRLTRSAFNFDPALKQHHGIDKWIYKEALRDHLPAETIDRKKEGFPVPIEFWFSESFQSRFKETQSFDNPIFLLGLINDEYTRFLWKQSHIDHRYLDYRLYCLNKFLKKQSVYVK